MFEQTCVEQTCGCTIYFAIDKREIFFQRTEAA